MSLQLWVAGRTTRHAARHANSVDRMVFLSAQSSASRDFGSTAHTSVRGRNRRAQVPVARLTFATGG
jgi:hypothetical protein